MSPKYTFLLPAYKSQFFKEALESIKNQSFQDFKVIVSDDCSSENLKEIFDIVVGDDYRFVYRRNKENIGSHSLVAHWNMLVELCETEYFIMASDDDVYSSNYLLNIDILVKKYPECNIYRGRAQYIDAVGNIMVNDALWPEFTDNMHFILMAMADMTISCEANMCYKTQAFKSNGGYQVFPAAWFTDDATHIKMASNGCACTNEIVFGFRSSSVNISSQNNKTNISKQKIEATLQFWDWIIKHLQGMEYEAESYLKNWTMRECRKAVQSQFDQHIIHCKWKDFLNFTKIASHTLGLSLFVYTYYWLRFRIKAT